MREFEASITVHAAPEAVFAFISDIGNLPKYLPTTHAAEAQGPGRVHVEGEAEGHHYDSDGYFRVQGANRRLEWGSDGEHNYKGWMDIRPEQGKSKVTVHLSLDPEGVVHNATPPGGYEQKIVEGLNASLKSIKNLVEGNGGKVEPPAAT